MTKAIVLWVFVSTRLIYRRYWIPPTLGRLGSLLTRRNWNVWPSRTSPNRKYDIKWLTHLTSQAKLLLRRKTLWCRQGACWGVNRHCLACSCWLLTDPRNTENNSSEWKLTSVMWTLRENFLEDVSRRLTTITPRTRIRNIRRHPVMTDTNHRIAKCHNIDPHNRRQKNWVYWTVFVTQSLSYGSRALPTLWLCLWSH